jgi:hypothetical protein
MRPPAAVGDARPHGRPQRHQRGHAPVGALLHGPRRRWPAVPLSVRRAVGVPHIAACARYVLRSIHSSACGAAAARGCAGMGRLRTRGGGCDCGRTVRGAGRTWRFGGACGGSGPLSCATACSATRRAGRARFRSTTTRRWPSCTEWVGRPSLANANARTEWRSWSGSEHPNSNGGGRPPSSG